MHFVLSRRQIDSAHLTLPKRHRSLSSCRQKAFKFNTSCGDDVHYRLAPREYMATLRPLSASSRCAIRTLLKRNQATSDFLADLPSHAAARHTPRSAYRPRRLPTTSSPVTLTATPLAQCSVYISANAVEQCYVIIVS